MKKIYSILFFLSTLPGQLSITSTDPTSFTIDFDTVVPGVVNGPFDGSGFQATPAAGRIDSDGLIVKGLSQGDMFWGDDSTTGDFARGSRTGHVGTGGIYSFEVSSGDFTLGVQPIGFDFTPGHFILKVTNNTGIITTHFTLNYDIYIYNDQDRSNSFNFSYSSDDVIYTPIAAMDYTSPATADVSPAWQLVSRSVWINNFSVSAGGSFYLKWTGDNIPEIGSGYMDEFALDNISVSIGNALETDLLTFPMQFKFWNAFPNPFNPVTTIQYSLFEKGPVEILAFNLQGGSVGTLLQCDQTAGEHSYLWDAHNLPSGTYLIRLSSAGETETQKVTLLK